MKASRLTSVVLFSLSLLLALGLGFVQAGPVQAQEGAGIPLVKFEGVIETIVDDVWTIDEQAVTVTDTTIVVETEGEAVVGAGVVVIAKKVMVGEQETLEAILIRVKPAQATRVVYLAGLVDQYVAGEKLVLENGKTVLVNDGTVIQGALAEGKRVLIKARFNGTVYVALRIDVVEAPMQRIVEFDGIVTVIGDTQWTVGDRAVQVNSKTIIQGIIVVGNRVKVRAYRDGEDLVALLIKKAGASWWPKMDRFSGPIVSFPAAPYTGDWVINDGQADRTVTATHFTRIQGVPVVGAIAHVTAWSFLTDGKCVAMEIKIEGSGESRVNIAGTIKQLPERGLWGTWIITEGAQEQAQVLADREVLVLPGTWIEGMPQVGDEVKIEAVERQDGVVVAKKISLVDDDDEPDPPFEGVHLMGKITEVGAGYIVIRPVVPFGTIKLNLSNGTVVNGGPLAVGQCVAVRAKGMGSQQYEAIEITVGACPGSQAAGKVIGRTVD